MGDRSACHPRGPLLPRRFADGKGQTPRHGLAHESFPTVFPASVLFIGPQYAVGLCPSLLLLVVRVPLDRHPSSSRGEDTWSFFEAQFRCPLSLVAW